MTFIVKMIDIHLKLLTKHEQYGSHRKHGRN